MSKLDNDNFGYVPQPSFLLSPRIEFKAMGLMAEKSAMVGSIDTAPSSTDADSKGGNPEQTIQKLQKELYSAHHAIRLMDRKFEATQQ